MDWWSRFRQAELGFKTERVTDKKVLGANYIYQRGMMRSEYNTISRLTVFLN